MSTTNASIWFHDDDMYGSTWLRLLTKTPLAMHLIVSSNEKKSVNMTLRNSMSLARDDSGSLRGLSKGSIRLLAMMAH